MTPGRGAVVFDLFHTLANPDDYRPPDFDRVVEASNAVGLPPALVREHWIANFERIGTSTIEPIRFLEDLCHANGVDPGPQDLAAADFAIGRFQDDALRSPIPGSVDVLTDLRSSGWAVGLLSNAHVRDIRDWPHSPLADVIDVAHFSCHQGVAKPDPTAFAGVLAELGAAAGQSVFVGDGGSNEIPGARGVGFAAVVLLTGPALNTGLRSHEEIEDLGTDADAVIDEIGELPGLMERLVSERR